VALTVEKTRIMKGSQKRQMPFKGIKDMWPCARY